VRATARGSAANLIGVVATSAVNLALVIVATRGLDRSAAGAVFAVTSLYFLVETGVRLGTDTGVVHFVAGNRSEDRARVADLIVAALVPIVPAMLVGGVVVGVLTPVVVHSLGGGGSVTHVGLVALLVGLALPVGAMYDFLTVTTRGLGASAPTVMVERIMRPTLQIVAVAAVVAAGGGASLVIVAWVAPYAVVAPVMAVWLRRLLRAAGVPLRSSRWRTVFREVWSFTLPRSFTGIVQILLQRLDILIVGAILGGPAAAIYTGATRFVVVGQLGNQALSYVFQPQLAKLLSRDKIEEARELFRVSTAWIIGLNAPLYLSVCVTAPLLVRLLGPRYHHGITSMVIVTGASLVGSSCGLVDFVLITMGRTSWNLWNSVAALAVNLTIDLVFIPHFGIKAAAIGWAAAILINNFVPLVQVHRAFGFTPVSGLWVRMLTLAGTAFGVIPGIALLVAGPSLPVMAGVLALAAAGYLAIVWSWRESLGLAQLLTRGVK
jgi:O-antigen/teichoic acid export membrane protein